MMVDNPPAAMRALQRLAHQGRVLPTHSKEKSAPAAGELDQVPDHVALGSKIFRVHEVRHAEAARHLLARGVDIDAHDHPGTDEGARPG